MILIVFGGFFDRKSTKQDSFLTIIYQFSANFDKI